MGKVGLALIAKNEEQNLPRLLDSIDGAFDRVVLLDTGSTDDTIGVFLKWTATQPEGFTSHVGRYEWKHDFADARQTADSLLLWGDPSKYDASIVPLVDWKCWADCDDTIVGASNIRSIVAQVPEQVVFLFAGYQYVRHPDTGACICYLRRERLTRVPHGLWAGRVHEAQQIDAPMMQLPPEQLEYVHHKDILASGQTSNDRNIEILEKWNDDEPDNSRVVGYLGTEHAAKGDHAVAMKYFAEYLALNPEWDEERAQVYRKYAQSLFTVGATEEGYALGFDAMRVLPSWPDNYLTLAEACTMKGEWSKAFEWAKRALEIGAPDTMLIINPLDYSFLPMKIMAGCLGELGRHEEAVGLADRALALSPDPHLVAVQAQWRIVLKRESTANTACMMAELLINHDEQMKALTFLEECVPYYCHEHPKVVQLRSFLRQRLSWMHTKPDFEEHYESGGSKPEDFIPDEKVDALCEYLPRTNFLLENLLEQANG